MEEAKREKEAKLVRARVVAKDIDAAISSVYRAAKTGKIPSYNVGPKKGGVRFDLEEVREALRRPVNAQKDAVK